MKKVLISILLLSLGIGIGFCFSNILSKEEQPKENLTIKKSPYTLDEIYAVVENPEKYYELNSSMHTEFNEVLFHFYDYFSKSTPFKVATKVEKNNPEIPTRVTKVLEVEYIDYEEYMKRMQAAYQYEELELKSYEERNKKYNQNGTPYWDYRFYVNLIVYQY